MSEPDALVPVARLFGVGDVVLRNDLEYERFNTPRPYVMWNALHTTPGLGTPQLFGAPGRNDAREPRPLLDSLALAEPADQPATPPVAIFPVENALAINRTVPYASPMVVAGDAEGLVDLAAIGLLDPEQAIFYSASFAGDPAGLSAQLEAGATLVVTDTNAKRGLRWGSTRENQGYVERADEEPAPVGSLRQPAGGLPRRDHRPPDRRHPAGRKGRCHRLRQSGLVHPRGPSRVRLRR